jgi:hypothetical protein
MPEDFMPADLAQMDVTATDSLDDAQDNSGENERSDKNIQCQNGVCKVVWKPARASAAA